MHVEQPTHFKKVHPKTENEKLHDTEAHENETWAQYGVTCKINIKYTNVYTMKA